jgi:hypothetical protein
MIPITTPAIMKGHPQQLGISPSAEKTKPRMMKILVSPLDLAGGAAETGGGIGPGVDGVLCTSCEFGVPAVPAGGVSPPS